MPNLLEPIKALVLAQYPDAVIVERGRNHIRHYSSSANRYILDSSLGSYHYHDGVTFQEINTDIVDSDDGNYIDANNTAPYKFYSGNNSQKRLYPRRDRLNEYVTFARPQYWTGSAWANLTLGTRTRTGDILLWDRPAFSLSINLRSDGIGKTIVLKNSSAAKRIRWPVTLTGLTWNNWQLISVADGIPVANIYKPTMEDAVGNKGTISCDYVNGAVEFTADLTGLVYPVTIDPTIDVHITAGANDTGNDGDALWSATDFIYVGKRNSDTHCDGSFRFPSITGLSGATITSAYMKVYCSNHGGTPLLRVYAEDADAPAQVTSQADLDSRTRTTAYYDWDITWVTDTEPNAPLTDIIQELANSYDPTVIQIFIEDDGSSVGYNYAKLYPYEQSPTVCANLHVEYTAGGATATGALDVTLAAFTLSATAQNISTGSLAKTFINATLTSAGVIAINGVLDKTLADATLISSGYIPSAGTLDATLASATLIASGAVPANGLLSETLADFSLASIGTAGNSGSLDKTLGDATLLSSGTSIIAGVLSKTLDNVTLISTGSIPDNGTLDEILSDFTISATGISTAFTDGNLSVTLENATLVASGTSIITGQLSKSLASFTTLVAGTQTNTGQLDSTLAGATVTATGIGTQITAVLIAILSNATLTASGITPVHWHQNQLRPRIWTRDYIARNNIKYRKRKW